jgi:hypothetical protein
MIVVFLLVFLILVVCNGIRIGISMPLFGILFLNLITRTVAFGTVGLSVTVFAAAEVAIPTGVQWRFRGFCRVGRTFAFRMDLEIVTIAL